VDEDAMAAIARSAVCPAISFEKIAQNRCKGSLGGID
jgi:hypothetical protein